MFNTSPINVNVVTFVVLAVGVPCSPVGHREIHGQSSNLHGQHMILKS
jgi:hypothetical protein